MDNATSKVNAKELALIITSIPGSNDLQEDIVVVARFVAIDFSCLR